MTGDPSTFCSTRGRAPEVGFVDALLGGMAPDGGLYWPAAWPVLPSPEDLPGVGAGGVDYAAVAEAVMAPYVGGEIPAADFRELIEAAYATFDSPEVVPLRRLGDRLWGAELFHGPTLAFKDVALQLVGRLFEYVLESLDRRITILGATSGDTGSAALEACRGLDRVDVVILYPRGGVSEVQRRQMTTIPDANCWAVAVEGTFDDCQDLVKAAFADAHFRAEVGLSAVNSINWARVMAQIVYYVTSAAGVNAAEGRPLDAPVDFCVPTGNFGNVLAGWVAARSGLAVDRFVVASNRNDILTRAFTTGVMEIEPVVPSTSPSMDIQVSSNLERLLFEAVGRNGAVVDEVLTEFRSTGRVGFSDEVRGFLGRWFAAGCASDEEVAEVIGRHWREGGILLDPHSAVGVCVGERWLGASPDPDRPLICLETAHPAKFPDAVEQASGVRPGLPDHLADLFDRSERTEAIPADLDVVRDLLRARCGRRDGSPASDGPKSLPTRA